MFKNIQAWSKRLVWLLVSQLARTDFRFKYVPIILRELETKLYNPENSDKDEVQVKVTLNGYFQLLSHPENRSRLRSMVAQSVTARFPDVTLYSISHTWTRDKRWKWWLDYKVTVRR